MIVNYIFKRLLFFVNDTCVNTSSFCLVVLKQSQFVKRIHIELARHSVLTHTAHVI